MNGNFGGGEGTESNPWEVEDIEDFLQLVKGKKDSENLPENSYFKLITDIDFSDYEDYKWQFPILPAVSYLNRAHLDGNNCTIKNMIFRADNRNQTFESLSSLKRINIENLCLINFPINARLFFLRSNLESVNISCFLFNSSTSSIFNLFNGSYRCIDCTFNIKGFSKNALLPPTNSLRCHFNFDTSSLFAVSGSENGIFSASSSTLDSCYFTGETRLRKGSNNGNSNFFLFDTGLTLINCYINIKADLKSQPITTFEINYQTNSSTRCSFMNKDAIELPENCTIAQYNTSDFYPLTYEQCCDPKYLLDTIGFPVIKSDE